MADPNNIPQESQQLAEDLNSPDEDTKNKASANMAKTNFDAEYEEAQKNSSGSGSQSSDPNPVSRKAGSKGTAGSDSFTSGTAGRSQEAGKIDDIDSPGDSDPDDYLDMAREVTKGKGES